MLGAKQKYNGIKLPAPLFVPKIIGLLVSLFKTDNFVPDVAAPNRTGAELPFVTAFARTPTGTVPLVNCEAFNAVRLEPLPLKFVAVTVPSYPTTINESLFAFVLVRFNARPICEFPSFSDVDTATFPLLVVTAVSVAFVGVALT